MWWLAAITMVAANLMALVQSNVKRMLAYSSVAHAGYLLLALTAARRRVEPPWITQSWSACLSSAQTLRALMVFETPVLTSTNMLRLVRGCPLIVDVSWYQEDGDSSATEEDNCNAINRLLKSRGGKEMSFY